MAVRLVQHKSTRATSQQKKRMTDIDSGRVLHQALRSDAPVVAQFNAALAGDTTLERFNRLLQRFPGLQLVSGDERGVTPLMALVKRNNYLLVDHVLSTYGASLAELCDLNGETAAHYAARLADDQDALRMMTLLHSRYAPMNVCSYRDETPLEIALFCELSRTASLLSKLCKLRVSDGEESIYLTDG